MPAFHLAQVNIAQLIAPEGDPVVAEFFDNVPQINKLAESSNGFVWRYDGDYPDPMIAFNLSVWASIEDLSTFVYHSAHVEIFRKRKNWFVPMKTAHFALWWIEAGNLPSPDQSLERLELLDKKGHSPEAFTFAKTFEPPVNPAIK